MGASEIRSAYAAYRLDVSQLNRLLQVIEAFIRRIASRLLTGPAARLVDDAVQEALIATWSNLGSCRGDIAAWVGTIARRACYNALRSGQRGHEMQQDDDVYDLPPALTGRVPNVPEVTLSAVESQIARLLADNATEREIADELGISQSTVHHHIEHMRRKFEQAA